jgi:hypothetical protein
LAIVKYQKLKFLYSLSKVERQIVSETSTILKSAELGKIRAAHQTGEIVEVSVGGRTILYQPHIKEAGLSLFGENGFVIGNGAFKSEAELTKTILHELHRLNTSTSKITGVSAELAASETKGTAQFAEKAYNGIFRK